MRCAVKKVQRKENFSKTGITNVRVMELLLFTLPPPATHFSKFKVKLSFKWIKKISEGFFHILEGMCNICAGNIPLKGKLHCKF